MSGCRIPLRRSTRGRIGEDEGSESAPIHGAVGREDGGAEGRDHRRRPPAAPEP